MDFSNKSLDLCQTYSNQADQLLKQSKQSLKKYNNSLSKLDIIVGEISKQINILKETSDLFNDKNNNFINEYSTLLNLKHQTFNSIDNKLELLNKKVLDKGLVFKNKQQNNSLNTLYDFIDTESLELIRNQFIQEVNGLSDLCDKIGQIQINSSQTSSDIEIQFLDLQNQFDKEIKDNNNDKKNNNNDFIINQHNLYSTINNTIINITSQCDFISYFKPSASPLITQQQQLDFSKEINNKKEQIQLYLANAAENILLLSKNVKEFEEKCKRINHLYSLAFIIYDKLSGSISNDFSRNLEMFERYCSIFDQRYSAANYFLGELISLNKWYELFDESYDNLLEEVKRRQKEFLRQKTLAEQFEFELKQQFDLELENRMKFYDQFGKFLPVSLFETISDPPIQFQIKQIEIIDIFPQNQDQQIQLNQQKSEQ